MYVGLTIGSFDQFSDGHDYFLRQAQECCNYLIVALLTDERLTAIKGPDFPVWNFDQRVARVAYYADAVIPLAGCEMALIQCIHPNALIRGADQLDLAQVPDITYVRVPHVPYPQLPKRQVFIFDDELSPQ